MVDYKNKTVQRRWNFYSVCLTYSPNLLKSEQAAPSAEKVIEKEKLLFPENLCLAIKTHRMRENKKKHLKVFTKCGEKYSSKIHV